jgi:hypothetical protein
MGWLVIQGLSGTSQTRPGPLDTGGSGHGDFAGYHQRFGHSPEAIKTCTCGQVVRRGHLDVCPIATWGNPDATWLDARAFYKTLNLYLSRVNELRQYGEILDPLTLEPLPISLIFPLGSPRLQSQQTKRHKNRSRSLFHKFSPIEFPLLLLIAKNVSPLFL